MSDPSDPAFEKQKSKDHATAILDKKPAPNKLSVQESKQDEATVIEMTEAKLEELKLMSGDNVLLRGKHNSYVTPVDFRQEAP
jgi:formylmethanofuran dehydrogenase subunit D